MDDLLCCARCKEPLKIVCEAHGTEWVPDRRVNPIPATVAPPIAIVPKAKRTSKPPRPDSITARILDSVSTSAAHPSSAGTVAAALSLVPKRVGIELAALRVRGLIERVRFGYYYRRPTSAPLTPAPVRAEPPAPAAVAAPIAPPRPKVERQQAAPWPESRRGKIFARVSVDRSAPSIAGPIADALGLPKLNVATELSNMCSEGYLERVGRGQYIRRPQRGGDDAGI